MSAKDLTFILTTPGDLRVGIQSDEVVVTFRGSANLKQDLIDFYRGELEDFFKELLDDSRVQIFTEEERKLIDEAEEAVWAQHEKV